MDYRATEGGWIRLALKNVAGDAALISVEIAASSKDDESPQAWYVLTVDTPPSLGVSDATCMATPSACQWTHQQPHGVLQGCDVK
jgi:hypothetical protein